MEVLTGALIVLVVGGAILWTRFEMRRMRDTASPPGSPAPDSPRSPRLPFGADPGWPGLPVIDLPFAIGPSGPVPSSPRDDGRGAPPGSPSPQGMKSSAVRGSRPTPGPRHGQWVAYRYDRDGSSSN